MIKNIKLLASAALETIASTFMHKVEDVPTVPPLDALIEQVSKHLHTLQEHLTHLKNTHIGLQHIDTDIAREAALAVCRQMENLEALIQHTRKRLRTLVEGQTFADAVRSTGVNIIDDNKTAIEASFAKYEAALAAEQNKPAA